MAYKVFTNGSPLPASDLNTYLMNQSVMVFANSTARSAALTSPTEGMTTYLEDTNKVEVWTGAAWTDINDNSNAILKSTVTATGDLIIANGNASVTRLGIGTNGQVLTSNGTTAVWGSAQAGSITQISTTTLTGSTVSVTSIPQTYKHLQFIFKDYYTVTNAVAINMRPNGDSSSVNVIQFWSANPGVSSGSDPNGDILYPSGNSSTDNGTVVLEIFDYTVAKPHPFRAFGNLKKTTNIAYQAAGAYENDEAITSVDFVVSGGFGGGTLELYGVK